MCRPLLVFAVTIGAVSVQGISLPITAGRETEMARWSADEIIPGPTPRRNVLYPQGHTTAPKPVTNNKHSRDKIEEYGDEYEDTCILTAIPPDPDSQCCGVDASSHNRIMGGDSTQIEQYPWLVQIEYYNRILDAYKSLCGGFLISGRYVVSAAHCFVGAVLDHGRPINVILGDYNIANEGPDCINTSSGVTICNHGAIRVPIDEYIVPKKYTYNGIRIYNDIVLVRLSKTVEYTTFIRPICLPTSDVTVSPPRNLPFFVAGWGRSVTVVQGKGMKYLFPGSKYTDVKQHVNIPFKDTEECSKTYTFLNNGHICAGGERGKDSCDGDSGGPLMLKNDSVYEAVGIVSSSLKKYECGTEGRPAVYTKLYPHLTWIKDNIKN